MHTVRGRNVNEVFAVARIELHAYAQPDGSRNGGVLRLPGPLFTEVERPRERVLFDAVRDANPFFHLMEGLWMLAGSNDVAWLAQFNRRMTDYSDDGVTFAGAYGHRWRHHFGRDQLLAAAERLAADPTERRVVLGMWDPRCDGPGPGRDVPCNLAVVPTVRSHQWGRLVDDRLDLLITARGHDLIWGLFGANVVHFSMLQEWLAEAISERAGVPLGVGALHFATANAHVYAALWGERWGAEQFVNRTACPYELGWVHPYPLFYGGISLGLKTADWELDLMRFLGPAWDREGYSYPYFYEVAQPLRRAWDVRRENVALALEHVRQCRATDWRLACGEWLVRHYRGIEVPQAWYQPGTPREPVGEDAT